MRAIQKLKRCWSVMMLAAMGVAANADTVFYDNDTGRKGGFYNSGGEFGDEVVLGADVSESRPVSITGAYVVLGPNGYTGGASVSINIRALDGPVDSQGLPTPGNPVGGGSASVPAISRATRIYVPVSATLKSKKFVWTARISAASTVLGVVVADPPSGGSSLASELWASNDGTTWATRGLTGGNPANLAIAFLTSSGGGSEVLRVGGGSAGGVSTSLSYREGTPALSIGAGSLVAFDGTKNLTIEVPAADAPLGDELLAGGKKGAKLEFTGVSQSDVRGILDGLQYQNLSKSARGGAHVINVSLGSLSGSMTVNLTAVNDAPVVALANASQATIETASFAAGAQAPIEVPFTYLDPESGVANVTVTALSDNEQVIKNANLEVVLGAADATGRGTGVLKIKAAEVATGTAYPDGLPIAIVATDRSNAKGSIIFKLKVTSSNKAPTFVLQNVPTSGIFEINEDTVLKVGFTVSDDKTADLLFTAVSDKPALISASSETIAVKSDAGGTFFEIKPVLNQNEKSKNPAGLELGVVKLTLSFDDKEGGKTSRDVNVRIVPVNDAPVLKSDKLAYTVEEDAKTFPVPFTVSDVDVGDPVSLSLGAGAGEVTVGTAVQKLLQAVELVTTGAGAPFLNVTVAPGASGGPAPIKLIATDAAGLKSELDFTIAITEVNDAPVFAEMQSVLVDGKATDALKFKVLDEKPVLGANLSAVSDNITLVPNDFTLSKDGDFWVFKFNVQAFPDASFLDAGGKPVAAKDVTINITAKDPEGLSTTVPVKLNIAKRKTAPFVLIGDTDTLEAKTVEATADNGETFTTGIGVDDLGTLAAALKVDVTITGNGTTAAPIADAAKLEVTSDTTALGKIRNVKLPLNKGRSGVVTLVVKVTDADGDSTEKTLTLTVKEPSSTNTAPVVSISDGLRFVVTPNSDFVFPFDVDDSETDPKQVVVSATQDAAAGSSARVVLPESVDYNSIDPVVRRLTVKIPGGASGTVKITVTADDTGAVIKRTKETRVPTKAVYAFTGDAIMPPNPNQGGGGAGDGAAKYYVPNDTVIISFWSQVRITSASGGFFTRYIDLGNAIGVANYRLAPGQQYIIWGSNGWDGSQLIKGEAPSVDNGGIPSVVTRTESVDKLAQLKTTKSFTLVINAPPTVGTPVEEVAAGTKAVYPELSAGKIQITDGVPSKAVVFSVSDPDVEDRDALTVSASTSDTSTFSGASGVVLTPLGGGRYSLVLNPKLAVARSGVTAAVAVEVLDPSGNRTAGVLEVTVVPPNVAPVVGVKIADQVVKNNKPFEFQIPATAFTTPDPTDAGKLKFSAKLDGGAALPEFLSITDAGVLTFTPAKTGTVVPVKLAVVVTATAPVNGSATSAPFVVDIIEGNNAPVADLKRLTEQTATVGRAFAFNLANAFSDVDGDALVVSVVKKPTWMNFNATASLLSGTPAKTDILAAQDVVLKATDAGGKSVEAGFVLRVDPAPNRAPKVKFALSAAQTFETAQFKLTLPGNAFEDADEDDVLTLSVDRATEAGLPTWLSFDPVTRLLSGKVPIGAAGNPLTFKVTASDKAKASVSQTFTLFINARPSPPTMSILGEFGPPPVIVSEDSGTFSVRLNRVYRQFGFSPVLPISAKVSFSNPAMEGMLQMAALPSQFDAGQLTIPLNFTIKPDGKYTGRLVGNVILAVTLPETDDVVTTSFELRITDTTAAPAEAKYVTAVYNTFLNRAPTETELSTTVTALQRGGNERNIFVQRLKGDGTSQSRLAGFVEERFLRRSSTGAAAGLVGSGEVVGMLTTLLSSSDYYQLAGGDDLSFARYLLHDLGTGATDSGVSFLLTQIQQSSRESAVRSQVQSNIGPILQSLLGFASNVGAVENLRFSFADTVANVVASDSYFQSSVNGSNPSPQIRVVQSAYSAVGTTPGTIVFSVNNSWGPMTTTAWDLSGVRLVAPVGLIFKTRAQGSTLIVTYNPPPGSGLATLQTTASVGVQRDFEGASSTVSVGSTQGYTYSNVPDTSGNTATVTMGSILPDRVIMVEGTSRQLSIAFQGSPGVGLTFETDRTDMLRVGRNVQSFVSPEFRGFVITPEEGVVGDARVTFVAKSQSGVILDQKVAFVTVLPKAPVITADPVDVTAVAGSVASFAVRATGASLAYQWERYSAATGDFVAIEGQKSPAYSTTDNETVRVKVSNAGGVVTSTSARVVRPVAPSGVVQAPSIVAQGSSARFAVTQIFSSYQDQTPRPAVSWFRLDAAGNREILREGLTYTIENATAANSGTFFARITDRYSEWVSDPLTLRVRVPLSIAESPKSQSVKIGQPLTLKVVANGDGPFEYQWRKNGQPLRSVTGDTITIQAASLTDAGRYVVVVSKAGSDSATSGEALVEVETQNLGFADGFGSSGSFSGAQGSGGGKSTTASADLENGEPRVIINGPSGTQLESAVFYTMWTRWTAPAKGVVSFETTGSSYDTMLSVYTGTSIGVLQKVAEDDDSGPNRTSRVTFNTAAGTQYHIRVGLRSGEAGPFAFAWNFVETALTAPTITAVTPTFTGTSANAALGLGELKLAATVIGDAPLTYQWFRSRAPLANGDEGAAPLLNSGSTDATFTRSGKFSKLIGDYYLVVSNPAGSVQSAVVSIRSQGEGSSRTLYKQLLKQPLDGLRPGGSVARQDLTSSSSRALRPQALGVVTLSQFAGSQLLVTEGETVDAGEPNHAGVAGGASVWFSITPPTSGRLSLSTDGETDYDTVLAVYTGKTNKLGFLDYTTLVEVGSDNNSGANGLTSKLTIVAEAGKEYFIAVDGVNGTSGVLEFAYKLDVAPTLTGLKDVVLKQNSAGSTIQFKADDSLAGSGGLTIRLLSSDPGLIDPAKIVVGSTGADRTIELTPEFNRVGTATLTLLVEDGVNVTTGTLNVTVEAVNQRPTAAELNVALAEDSEQAVVLGGTDPEGKALTFKLLTQPARGKLTGTAPNLTYLADTNTFGNDQFTYSVSDGLLESSPVTVTLSVVAVNDAPSITKVADVTGKAGTPTDALKFSVADLDTDLASVSVLAQSDNQILVADGNIIVTGTGADRTVTVYPSAEKTGKAVITLTAIDEGGGTASSSFTLSIASAPPTLSTQPQSVTVLEGETAAFFVQARGTGPFTYQWRKDGKDVVSRTGGTFSIAKVTAADAGKYSVVVKTPVGTVTSEEATLTVTPKVVLPTKLSAEATVNGFVLHFTSAPGPYRLQGSVDLINWVTLTSEDTTTGVIDYTDKDASKNVMRFYRVIQGR